jgi:hypothetical protein
MILTWKQQFIFSSDDSWMFYNRDYTWSDNEHELENLSKNYELPIEMIYRQTKQIELNRLKDSLKSFASKKVIFYG